MYSNQSNKSFPVYQYSVPNESKFITLSESMIQHSDNWTMAKAADPNEPIIVPVSTLTLGMANILKLGLSLPS